MGMTKQRAAVLNAVNSCKDHPTADTIFHLTRQAMPNVGLGTVYRNLNILCDEGKVLRVRTPGGPDHFDFNTARHDHFYCTCCGNVFDIDLPEVESATLAAARENGLLVTGYHLIAEGLCQKCVERRTEAAVE